MKSGRQLDALVAEKVMGLSLCEFRVTGHIGESRYIACAHANEQGYYPADYVSKCYSPELSLAHYSTSIEAAWQVVDHLRKKLCCLRLVSDHHYLWEVYGIKDPDDADHDNPIIVNWKIYAASEESAPHAICLAALKAMGVNAED